jgi:hypothetical protein
MNEYIYEVIENSYGGKIIKRTDYSGKEVWIPLDQSNSDYNIYLDSLNDNASEAE